MRAALYARVSSEEQVEGYSIDAQRRAFKTLVDARGWTIYNEYVEEGKSARTEDINKRPLFKETITDALAGKFDVLVVHKLDRFSRNLRITLEYFDKLLKAGVAFISINEQMDFTTPSGKVHLALLGADSGEIGHLSAPNRPLVRANRPACAKASAKASHPIKRGRGVARGWS